MNATTATPNTLPIEIYNELDEYLRDLMTRDNDCDCEGCSSTYFDFESEDGYYYISGKVEARYEYEDDSFSHAFGVEECGHWEFCKIESLEIDTCGYYNYDGDNDIEIALKFDYEIFDHLHDVTTVKIDGVAISTGDEVVVQPPFGKWLLGTFKYYDPDEEVYYFEGSHWNYARQIKPATEQNRQLIGKY